MVLVYVVAGGALVVLGGLAAIALLSFTVVLVISAVMSRVNRRARASRHAAGPR